MFSLSPQVKTTLSPETLCTFTELLEAQYHYNTTLLELEAEGPTYLPNMLAQYLPVQHAAVFRELLIVFYKAEVSKEKEFYQKYLQRIKTEENQQKILDDFFESVRKGLHSNLSIACTKKETFFSSCISAFFIQPLQDILKTIKPYVSPFQQLFAEYNKLIPNPHGGESLYEVHTALFKEWVLKELEKLRQDCEIHQDADGVADILNRQTSFEMEFMIAYCQLFPSEPIELNYKLNREWFYAFYNSLENARVLQERRKLLWKGRAFVAESVITTPSDLSGSSEEASENKDVSLETKLVEATEKLAVKSAESMRLGAEAAVSSSASCSSTGSVSTKLLAVKNTPLVFSKNKEKILGKEDNDLQNFQAKLKGKYKDVLVDLFYGKSLEKIHIPEKTLQSMVTAIGGTVTDGSGSRKRIFYQEKLGFIPNEPVVAHYHTKNTRYASPAVLAHYRDFFHRIKLTPAALWPNEYSERDYTFNRTTRHHFQAVSNYCS